MQREADRRDRKRKIESWTEKTGIARLSKDTAKTMEDAKDVLEDAVLGLVDLPVEAANNAAKTRILASVRAGYNRIHGLAVKLEVGNKYGTEAVHGEAGAEVSGSRGGPGQHAVLGTCGQNGGGQQFGERARGE